MAGRHADLTCGHFSKTETVPFQPMKTPLLGLAGGKFPREVKEMKEMKVEPGTNRPAHRDGANRGTRVLSARQLHSVPQAIRALSPTDPDYIDVFTLITNDASHRSPEQWARAAFEDVAGLQGQFIWRVLLGLRLKRRASPDHVAGWRVADRCDRGIRLEAHSWMLTGHLVVQVDDDQVSLATIIRYDRPIAARIWSPLSAVHRRLAPDLLRDAHRVQQPKPRR